MENKNNGMMENWNDEKIEIWEGEVRCKFSLRFMKLTKV